MPESWRFRDFLSYLPADLMSDCLGLWWYWRVEKNAEEDKENGNPHEQARSFHWAPGSVVVTTAFGTGFKLVQALLILWILEK